MSHQRVIAFNAPFDLMGSSAAIEFIQNNKNRKFSYVVTPNADHVVRLNDGGGLHEIYSDALISVCDSQIVSSLAKLVYGIKIEVVTGSDLTKELFDGGLLDNNRVCIIGGNESVIDKLRNKYPKVTIFHNNPPMGFIASAEAINCCVDFIRDNVAEYIIFAVGSPQQEILASHVAKQSDVTGVGLCVGASLLFLTGDEKRAPKIWSTIKMEWLYRLKQNPRRLWRRYLGNLRIFIIAFRELRKGRGF